MFPNQGQSHFTWRPAAERPGAVAGGDGQGSSTIRRRGCSTWLQQPPFTEKWLHVLVWTGQAENGGELSQCRLTIKNFLGKFDEEDCFVTLACVRGMLLSWLLGKRDTRNQFIAIWRLEQCTLSRRDQMRSDTRLLQSGTVGIDGSADLPSEGGGGVHSGDGRWQKLCLRVHSQMMHRPAPPR